MDICKCSGQGCPLKDKCFRFRAIAYEHRQSYFAIPPVKEDGSCDRFWEIDEKENRVNPIQKENNGQ